MNHAFSHRVTIKDTFGYFSTNLLRRKRPVKKCVPGLVAEHPFFYGVTRPLENFLLVWYSAVYARYSKGSYMIPD